MIPSSWKGTNIRRLMSCQSSSSSSEISSRVRSASARLAGSTLLACQSDERLVELTRVGHGRAFDALVERYRRPLIRFCARMLPESLGPKAWTDGRTRPVPPKGSSFRKRFERGEI